MSKSVFCKVEEALKDIKKGKMVIVVDDPSRENEGDLVCAAEKASPSVINFMAKHGRGLICVPMLKQRLDELEIGKMIENDKEVKEAAFTVSVDVKHGATTGISAHDRALTIKRLIDKKAKRDDFARPGHIFPLIYKEGGVLVRTGHTEAAVDIAKLAGLYPAGVICEIMKEDGKMARLPYLLKFAKKHSFKIITIADLIEFRRKNEKFVECLNIVSLPTEYGDFKLYLYKNKQGYGINNSFFRQYSKICS